VSHEDKFGKPLDVGDVVRVVYGGDSHLARVTQLAKQLDVDHVELELLTRATVPSGSAELNEKIPPTSRRPAPDPEPKRTAHRPVHRPATRSTRST
jgi:hypothetical protein